MPVPACTGGGRQKLRALPKTTQLGGWLHTRLASGAVCLPTLRLQPLGLLVGSRPLLAPHPVPVLRTVARQPPSPLAASLPGTLGPPWSDDTGLRSSWSATQATTGRAARLHGASPRRV